MIVKEIIKKYLEENGYDGLCNMFMECGCYLDDLIPCSEIDADECEAGHKVKDESGEYDWVIYPGKVMA